MPKNKNIRAFLTDSSVMDLITLLRLKDMVGQNI
jgi:hypothetical protein